MTAEERIRLTALQEAAREKYIPVMRTETAKVLERLVLEKNPAEILEIGTSIGTSGIIALLSGGGRLTTMEINGDRLEEARKNFQAFGLSGRVSFLPGDCTEELKYLEGNGYDFIILDGSKSQYGELYERLLPLLMRDGILFIDDIAYHGKVAGDTTAEHKHRTIVRAMRRFLDKLKEDKRVNVTLYPIEDGVAVIRKSK